jgi:PKD repeat protein
MKIYTRFLAGLLALLIGVTACGPQEEVKPEIGEGPKAEQVKFTYKVDEENPNIIYFTNASEVGFKAVWNFGNGTSAEGDQVKGEFAVKGEYPVTLYVYDRGGYNTSVQKITIEKTNPLMLDRPDYNMLTGGVDALDGKSWVVDKTIFGHIGVGPLEKYDPEWWAAPPMDKEGQGIYDDVMTFKLAGFGYEHETNGDIFVHVDHVEDMGGTPNGFDQKLPYTAPENMNWSIIEDAEGRKFLEINNEGFIGFYTGVVSTYEILVLEENFMYLRYFDTKVDRAWYLRLVPEGYEHPKKELKYTVKDLADDFEGNKTEAVVYYTDEVEAFVVGYDNPATFGANKSEHVAKYVRGEVNPYANLQVQFGYKIDLTVRNKFTLKVFLPSYNTYSADGLKQMVSLKLQDSSKGGSAWETQAEVKFENLETGTWHELEFDFSGYADRTDFDKLVIQLGGEAHNVQGTFFIDDFKLL